MTRSIILGLGICMAVACSSSSDRVGHSSASVTVQQPALWYDTNQYQGNVFDGFHGGTTASVVSEVQCCDPTCEPKTLFAAWEERRAPSQDTTGVFVGRSCVPAGPQSPLDNGTRLTAAITGTPPEWTSMTPMTFLGEPYLLPLGPQGWIALVALVGEAPNFKANVLVVLSTNGGQSWVHPHLLGDKGDSSGGNTISDGISVKWLAAARGLTIDNDIWLTGVTRSRST